MPLVQVNVSRIAEDLQATCSEVVMGVSAGTCAFCSKERRTTLWLNR